MRSVYNFTTSHGSQRTAGMIEAKVGDEIGPWLSRHEHHATVEQELRSEEYHRSAPNSEPAVKGAVICHFGPPSATAESNRPIRALQLGAQYRRADTHISQARIEARRKIRKFGTNAEYGGGPMKSGQN